ncbi:gb [Venturia nashicola]|uniref:Gb n=1 Tax=Venturia nashicola TaxID=86259 RepID=A0A4Z1P6G2_9PEZI|nr:gb [Venturia nashicola]
MIEEHLVIPSAPAKVLRVNTCVAFAVTQSLYDNYEFVAQLAAASYCPGNSLNSDNTGKLVCPKSNNCPRVEAAKTSIVAGIKNSPITDVTGFVALDLTNNFTVISFQGTESAKQTKADLNFNLKAISHVCADCTTHTGFWQSWEEARPQVSKAIDELRAKYPDHKLIVTGHSLGGAIATLAAAEMRSSGTPVDLYTYGAPRVGNQKLADYIQRPKEKLGENFRVTHYNDPVPRLPPPAMGFAHYTPEIYLAGKNNVKVSLSDIALLDASSVSKGTEQHTIVDVEAHRWYFNKISACYSANVQTSNSASADLATGWAPAVITLLGNNSGLVLKGGTSATSGMAAGVAAGFFGSMGASATNALLSLLPGGFLVQPFVPSPATAAAGSAGLVAGLGSIFGSLGSWNL